MMRGQIGVVLLILLAACRPAPSDEAVPPPQRIDANNPLEQAARDANLVVDPATTPPTGLFERTHAAGHDGICFKPELAAGHYRFGLSASFGSAITCEGSGEAVHQGNIVQLRFDDADCALDAAYDGNQVRLPGRVPAGCSRLCDERGNMAGIAIDRTGWATRDAAQLTSRRDALANRPPHGLCQ